VRHEAADFLVVTDHEQKLRVGTSFHSFDSFSRTRMRAKKNKKNSATLRQYSGAIERSDQRLRYVDPFTGSGY
jgi:hypothetical protein